MNGDTPNLIPDADAPEEPHVEEVGGQPTPLEGAPSGLPTGDAGPGENAPDMAVPGIPVPGESEPDFYSTAYGPHKTKNGDKRPRRRWPLFLVIGCMVMPCLCCAALVCGTAGLGATLAAVLDNTKATASASQTVDLPAEGGLLTLDVTDRVGSITIRGGGSADSVQIEYTKTAYGLTKEAAQKELNKITVDVTPPSASDNRLVIDANPARTKDTFFAYANQVNLTITVPDTLSIVVQNNVGDVTITGVTAHTLDVTNQTGTIHFEGALDVHEDARFSLDTQVGEITLTLPRDTYAALDAQTDVGSITVSSAFSVSNLEQDDSGPSAHWSGTLGANDEISAPPLDVRVKTGGITLDAQP